MFYCISVTAEEEGSCHRIIWLELKGETAFGTYLLVVLKFGHFWK